MKYLFRNFLKISSKMSKYQTSWCIFQIKLEKTLKKMSHLFRMSFFLQGQKEKKCEIYERGSSMGAGE